MKKINYLEILKRAFLLTWENKFLWFFGFFIFLGSFGSNLDVVFRGMGQKNQDPQFLLDFAQKNPNLFLAISAALFIFGIVIFLLKVVSVVALVKSASNIKLYSQIPSLKILVEAKKYLWKLVLLGLLIGCGIFVVATLLIIPIAYLFIIKAEMFAIMMAILAFVMLLPLLAMAIYLSKYAYFFVILGDFGIKDSLELAYVTLAKNIKESLVMGAISLGFSMAIMIVLASIGIIILAIFVALGFLANLFFANAGMIAVAVVGGLTVIFFLVAVLSWCAAFIQTLWLLFFQEITFEKDREKKVTQKVEIDVEVANPEVI